MWKNMPIRHTTLRKDKLIHINFNTLSLWSGLRLPVYEVWWTSLVAQMVKHLPTMWETWVQSLGQEDLLEKEMATHSSILVWKIPWTEDPGRLQSMGWPRVRHNWATSLTHTVGVNLLIFCWAFCIWVHEEYALMIFFSYTVFFWFWYQDNEGLVT